MNPIRKLLRNSVLGATLVLATGCAALRGEPAQDRAVLLTAAPALPGRQCHVSPVPERLPAADVLIDSAGLVDDLRGLELRTPGHVLLSLVYDTSGVNIRREVIEHSVQPAIADSVQKLVFAHRRETDNEERLGVRLRLDLGAEPEVRVGRQELCPPAPLDAQLESSMVHFRSTGTRYRQGERERVVWVRVAVNTNGTVIASQVERGAIGGVDFERQIFDFVRRYSFRPATEDGFPIRGEVSIPVRIRAG